MEKQLTRRQVEKALDAKTTDTEHYASLSRDHWREMPNGRTKLGWTISTFVSKYHIDVVQFRHKKDIMKFLATPEDEIMFVPVKVYRYSRFTPNRMKEYNRYEVAYKRL